ncbi:acetyl-CoA acetyltransferase [Pseudorhodoferax sp.]|uniref:acetyl-CoA acetyltransferase n=1 Tax=Pseudorhodoferax sp. TaxID=1993553 RepID=UPI002DD61EFE|nr:acetyl-CoA acetyltransferase [Pseudorhodoferax sp.]
MPLPTHTPVIVGVGQRCDTSSAPGEGLSPLQALVEVARSAAADSGCPDPAALLRALDAVTVIRLFSDTNPRFKSPFGAMASPPWSLAQALGAQPRQREYAAAGGDSPQTKLTQACRQVAAGEAGLVLLAGVEALRTELAARRAGLQLDWSDAAPAGDAPAEPPLRYFTAEEELHGMRSASAMYGLIAQAMRHAKGLTPAQYSARSAELFARFAAVARDNPYATRRAGYSAAQIAAVGADNPMVGTPYPKLMTASAFVDQAAAILVCSEQRAQALGIPRERWVYLHGAAAAHAPWFVSERADLVRSQAMRLAAQQALAFAGRSVADMAMFDFYSCFPSAVQAACDALGVAETDPRALTVTGGLSFFGGAGNNYSSHAIAEMVSRLRRQPQAFGLVLANGGLLTKESIGVYSAERSDGAWLFEAGAPIQACIDAEPAVALNHRPSGSAVVETFCVLWHKQQPQHGCVFGRLPDGARFLAKLAASPEELRAIGERDAIGLSGTVQAENGVNWFRLDRLPAP